MAKEEPDDPRFQGWRKYYNNHTIQGRANAAKIWGSIYILAYLVWRFTRKPATPSPPAAAISSEEMAINKVPTSLCPCATDDLKLKNKA